MLALLDGLQNGNYWVGMNMDDILKSIEPAQALRKLDGNSNCIWQLVNHIIYWRSTVVLRLQGVKDPLPYPDFSLPGNKSAASWKQTMNELQQSYKTLRAAINDFPENRFMEIVPAQEYPFYELIHGVIQHDGYHLGQIVLLSKYAH